MIKKAAIYDPYFDTLGGGERYILTVAETLLENGYSVDLFWDGDPSILAKAQDRFSLNLDGLHLVPDIFNLRPANIDECLETPATFVKSRIQNPGPITKIQHAFNKLRSTTQYDFLFFLSDGSVPFLLSKKNFLHVQVPFTQAPSTKTQITNRLKFLTIQRIITNSRFTTKFSDKYYGKKGDILYPPVDITKFAVGNKQKIILSVGRFDNILNAKRQDVLIEAFKTIHQHNPDWTLILAGGSLTDEDHNNYLKHLRYLAADLPVEFKVNPSFNTLKELYATAQIYWHAAGFEIDEQVHPEATEHFGITIVEAMAAGLVPVAVSKGGIPEIITDASNGYLWQDIKELVAKTQLLVGSGQLTADMSHQAIIDASRFSKENFKTNLLQLINS